MSLGRVRVRLPVVGGFFGWLSPAVTSGAA